jgi:phage terminase large subunit-like protein
VLVGRIGDTFHVKPTFFLPQDGLADKARGDRAPYLQWQREGFLEATPGKTISFEWVANFLRDTLNRYDIRRVAFDRALFHYLVPWLGKVGMTQEQTTKFESFNQGFVNFTGAVLALESAILSGKLRHGQHPVLTMCVANAVVKSDPAGQTRKLDKSKSSGRIDGAVALAMALGVASTEAEDPGEVLNRAILARGGFA